jgi:hypothetical protein
MPFAVELAYANMRAIDYSRKRGQTLRFPRISPCSRISVGSLFC